MTAAMRRGDEAAARLIVHAGARRFALPASQVRELVRLPRLTKVPLASAGLLGLAQVRGETLAVLSPLVHDGASHHPRQLVVLDGAERIALAVDMVERVTHDDDSATTLDIDELVRTVSPPRPAARRILGSGARTTASAARDERLPLLRFTISDQLFALPLDEIVEVLNVPQVAPLPGADDAVFGLIAWRETSLGVLSAASLLGLHRAAVTAQSRVIVVALGSHRFGLLVDRSDGLLRASSDRIDPIPPTLTRSDAEARIRAICRPENGGPLVSILGADHILAEAQTRRLLVTAQQSHDATATADASNNRRFIIAWIGEHRFGLPIEAIEKIAPRPTLVTSIPRTPAWLTGMAAVSGEPLILIDQVLRLTDTPATGKAHMIVTQIGRQRIGFLVDEARNLIIAPAGALSPAPVPETLAGGIYGDALHFDDDAALVIIDPVALMSSAEHALIESLGNA
ncbi:chemotaxis protein CheW [Sphingomonas montanisoli]|uniref:CheW-like domain-containing protein n=1 Tax=Sphingomonas montanisoli TaxID=2606412 RepID=A0A5D9CC61_9SPHN|nr:chemotaxis protein CheW [Sphingomonas montanisoli]TZG28712.1 hypothetical protein FYJ91_00755 [Sphingomonas montanisoli]